MAQHIITIQNRTFSVGSVTPAFSVGDKVESLIIIGDGILESNGYYGTHLAIPSSDIIALVDEFTLAINRGVTPEDYIGILDEYVISAEISLADDAFTINDIASITFSLTDLESSCSVSDASSIDVSLILSDFSTFLEELDFVYHRGLAPEDLINTTDATALDSRLKIEDTATNTDVAALAFDSYATDNTNLSDISNYALTLGIEDPILLSELISFVHHRGLSFLEVLSLIETTALAISRPLALTAEITESVELSSTIKLADDTLIADEQIALLDKASRDTAAISLELAVHNSLSQNIELNILSQTAFELNAALDEESFVTDTLQLGVSTEMLDETSLLADDNVYFLEKNHIEAVGIISETSIYSEAPLFDTYAIADEASIRPIIYTEDTSTISDAYDVVTSFNVTFQDLIKIREAFSKDDGVDEETYFLDESSILVNFDWIDDILLTEAFELSAEKEIDIDLAVIDECAILTDTPTQDSISSSDSSSITAMLSLSEQWLTTDHVYLTSQPCAEEAITNTDHSTLLISPAYYETAIIEELLTVDYNTSLSDNTLLSENLCVSTQTYFADNYTSASSTSPYSANFFFKDF